jgi:DNA-dependent RNA polymerase auxiliary subunit epsilon
MAIHKKWGIMLLTIALSLGFAGCTEKEKRSEQTVSPKKEETPTPPKKEDVEAEVRRVVEANAQHFNKEDLTKYMETISSSALAYEQTKKVSQALFQQFDLRLEIVEFKLLTFTDTAATVEVVQKATSKVPTPTYLDNISTTTHFLIKENGTWKFSNSAIKKMTDLNGKEIPLN